MNLKSPGRVDVGEGTLYSSGDKAPDRIVLVCGSAGALSFFLNFANQLPSISRASYIYLAHINHTGPSYLKDLLNLKLTLPVHEVEKPVTLKRGNIYIPTQGKDLIFNGNALESVEHDPSYYFTPSFNRSIETAVQSFGDNTMVAILSGRLDDGVAALQNVFEAGGVTLVQDPEEATYSSMPVAALKRDHPDCIRPSKEIGEEIAKFCSINELMSLPCE